MPAERPAFYALRPGGWRDYWTLLHPPYTAWHLSYVALGAAVSPHLNLGRLLLTLLGFFLAVGLAAHALDEVSGRPLGTRIPDRVLRLMATASLLLAAVLGVVVAPGVSWWLLAFVLFGCFIVVAYNLELFGGSFHNDFWFALAWGAFPALTGYFVQAAAVRLEAVLVAVGCMLMSAAQRRLSTPVRRLRREVAGVDGRLILRDGSQVKIERATLKAAPEAALRAMAVAMVALSSGLVVARLP